MHLKTFLPLAALLLVAACSQTPKAPEVDQQALNVSTTGWAEAFNARDWDVLEGYYADTVELNDVPMLKAEALKVISEFLREHSNFTAEALLFEWEQDTSIGDVVMGHLPFSVSPYSSGSIYAMGNISLAWKRDPNGKYVVGMQQDDLPQAFRYAQDFLHRSRMSEDPFNEEGQPNHSHWQEVFDSLPGDHEQVHAFTLYDDQTYFWVSRGTEVNRWEALSQIAKGDVRGIKCGLADEAGKLVVPMEFECLGNLNAVAPGLLEVYQRGKVGLYSLDGKPVARCEYDRILPAGNLNGSHVALLEKGGEYYGLTAQHRLEPLEMDAAAFGVVLRQLKLEDFFTSGVTNPGAPHPWMTTRMETGSWADGTCGILITPAFLRAYKGFPRITSLSMDYGNTQIPSLKIQDVKPVGEDKLGILALFDYWGAGGRDVYHATDKRMFTVDAPRAQQIAEVEVNDHNMGYTCDLISLEFVAENVLEKVETQEVDGYHEFPVYSYYSIDENGTLSPRPSHRKYPFTEYYDLTDAFFKGCYEQVDPKYKPHKEDDEMYWDKNHQPGIEIAHLPFKELELMKNEILAEQGQTFEGAWKDYFAKQSWYKAQDGDARSRLSERDRRNVEFIEGYLTRMAGKEKQLMFPADKAQG